MKKGSLGTILIGIILFISGINYWDDVAASVTPTDWQRLEEKEILEYQTNANQILYKINRDYDFGTVSYEEWRYYTGEISKRIELGKRKIHVLVDNLKSIDTKFFLMSHPTKFFMYLIVASWLIVVGIGFTIVLPWKRWFIYLTMITAYLWQTYVYIYEKAVDRIFQTTQMEIHRLLSLLAGLSAHNFLDVKTQVQILNTFIFLGMLYYFNSKAGEALFKERKEFSFSDYEPDSKIL